MIAGAMGLGLVLAVLFLMARLSPRVRPDNCPIFEDIRRGWSECGGPCTDERPLPCEEARVWPQPSGWPSTRSAAPA